MNILFYNINFVDPTAGGTERVTYSVACALKKLYGHRIFSLYTTGSPCNELFDAYLYCSTCNSTKILSFITRYHIDVIIVQGVYTAVKKIRLLMPNNPCRIIYVHHFEPGWEVEFCTIQDYLSEFKMAGLGNKLKAGVRLAFYPYFRLRYMSELHIGYKSAYEYSDATVLLCKKFIEAYQRFANISDSSRFHIIPNMLSFDDFYPIADLKNKQKKVLIVSRMDENPKRISLALELWKTIKKSKISDGWILQIVGDGKDLGRYKRLVEAEDIPQVEFYGKQHPKTFYENASIFFMTSLSEAWGLTLTEAQQFGVVPVAFDTYASLRDIITDGVNGYVVKEGDHALYVQRVLDMMQQETLRMQLAANAIRDSHRYDSETVGYMWDALLKNLKR